MGTPTGPDYRDNPNPYSQGPYTSLRAVSLEETDAWEVYGGGTTDPRDNPNPLDLEKKRPTALDGPGPASRSDGVLTG